MRKYTAWRLALALLRAPLYRVLISATDVVPPSPWTDEMTVEIDAVYLVIRLTVELT